MAEEVVEMLKVMGEGGDLESQVNLVDLYYRGEGVERDYYKSIYWAEQVINHPDAPDEYKIRNHLHIGQVLIFLKKNDEALKHYRMVLSFPNCSDVCRDVTELGIADALFLDKQEGFIQIYEAILQRHTEPLTKTRALLMLGSSYISGFGVPIDYSKGINLQKRALALSPDGEFSSVSLNDIGFAYEATKDYEQAMAYYLRADEKGSRFAPLNIGFLYQHGLGVDADSSIADKYYVRGKDFLEEWKLARAKTL